LSYEGILRNGITMNFIRMWLIILLLIIPFHVRINLGIRSWSASIAKYFNRMDELTVIILFPIAAIILYKRYKQGESHLYHYILLMLSIIAISIAGLISGFLNENALEATLLGTFAYVKFFFLIFIYAAFFRELHVVKKIIRYTVIIAVIVGIVAIAHEIWAILYKYMFDNKLEGEGLSYIINNFFSWITGDMLKPANWRGGIYRTSSLLSHYNLLGFYSILILTMYLHTTKKVNFLIFISLLGGIFVSVSRSAYGCFCLLAGIQVFKGRKWLAYFLIPFIILFFYINIFFHEIDYNRQPEDVGGIITYREYAADKAMTIWKDHPLLGVGPGMFGGDIAKRFHSPFYEEYNYKKAFLSRFQDLDQFWPQALAEIGIIGTAAFTGLIATIIVIFLNLKQGASSQELKDLYAGLTLLTLFIFLIHSFGSSMNMVSVMLTYAAFSGMGLGIERRM
jgi:hypothetical protein